jgi:hypothetical protein
MPIIKMPDGGIQTIPDSGVHRLITQHAKLDGTRIRNEYSFDMDTGRVQVDTYEDPMLHWGIADESCAQEIQAPKRIGGGERPLNDFLHHPEGKLPPDREHWTSRYRDNPMMEMKYSDPYRESGLVRLGKLDHEEWKRREIKKRGLRDAYGRYPKKTRKKATRGVNRSDTYEKSLKETELRYLEEDKGESVSQLTTGTRVRLADPTGRDKYATGTIVELKDGTPKGYSLVCMDVPSEEHYTSEPDICGEGHGFLVSQRNLRPIEPRRSRDEIWQGVPDHIGMCNQESFSFEKKKFPRYSIGRVQEMHNERVTLTWRNVAGVTKFYVPLDHMHFCRFEPGTNKVKNIWYTTRSPLVSGDILVYNSDKPHMLNGDTRNQYAMTRGVLLQHTGVDPDRCCINATIVAGMPLELLGTRVQLNKQHLRKHEGVFVPEGAKVEIIAEVVFKKKSLQGRRGKVVLATDFEGDVGIEFPEDIEAGSLDGAGREGRCLYIPTAAVKEISE